MNVLPILALDILPVSTESMDIIALVPLTTRVSIAKMVSDREYFLVQGNVINLI